MQASKAILFLVFFIYTSNIFSQKANTYTISGYVYEEGSKETLPSANIYIPKLKIGTTSNAYGFYSIAIPFDSIEFVVSYTGYKPSVINLKLEQNTSLDIFLANNSQLQEVVVSSNGQERISNDVQMSKIDLSIEQIKNLPALFGEKDVLKVIQLLPGVQKGSEGSSGLYVRGGGPDQNLIILDDATVYNASHLFGFFSLFNGSALKSVELTKGGFPARYGGRLSSVIDMQMKDGDKENIHGEVGIGLISSRLTLEGPIKKDRISFLISARRTYIDLLTKPFFKNQDSKVGYFFYDLNAKLNFVIDHKNKIYLSSYFGQDKFNLAYDGTDENNQKTSNKSGINWGNATATLRWNHLISDKMFSNLSLIFTNFLFDINYESKVTNNSTKLNYFSGIRDFLLKEDIDFYPNAKHSIKMGFISTYHYFSPNAVILKDAELKTDINRVIHIDTYENNIYIEDDWKISDKWRTNIGFRLSNFNVRTKSYFNLEPRLAFKYVVKKDLSLKASYAFMNQYLHLLSNSGIGLPSDLWVPATDKVKPQASRQIAIGLAKDLLIKDSPFLISLEGYYKKSKNVIGYKEGASFISVNRVNPQTATNFTYEDIVTAGNAESYGTELFIEKKTGKYTGWIGYTLSWTWLKFSDLNFGKRFPATYDRRHDISIVQIYKLSERITLSAIWVYSTGNSITLPISSYQLVPTTSPYKPYTPSESAIKNGYELPNNNAVVYDYGSMNSTKMPAYHRLDIAVQFYKKKKKYERIFEVGIYNAYNRQNPFFYQKKYDSQNRTVKLVQVTLFPIIPSVSWTWKF